MTGLSIPYDFAADILSIVVACQYAILIFVAYRRSRFRDRRRTVRSAEVVMHARWVEGPMLTVLFFIALLILVSRLGVDSINYSEILRLTIAAIRGALLVGGIWLMAAYWQARKTWL